VSNAITTIRPNHHLQLSNLCETYTAVSCDVLETNDCDDDDCVAAETDNGNKGFSSDSKKTRCKM